MGDYGKLFIEKRVINRVLVLVGHIAQGRKRLGQFKKAEVGELAQQYRGRRDLVLNVLYLSCG